MSLPVISITSANVVESSDSFPRLVFTVTLSQPAGGPVSVGYRTVQGSGTALDRGVDYFEKSGTVSFATGETSKTITVSAEGREGFDETDEGVVVELVNPFNGIFPESAVRLRATGFILDDDGDISDDGSRALLVSDLQVVEGDGGERTAVFELLLSRSSATSITVPYSTVDGSAVAGEDYVAAAGSVVFAPGETRQVVEVDLLGDEAIEATEFFSLVATPPASVGSGSAGAVGTAEILDDDTSPGLPEISITGGRVVESSESFPQLVYTVTLSQPAGGPVSVGYRTVQGSGTALDRGVDYFEKSGTVSFATGETSKTITVSAEGREGFDETDEGVVVELVNPSNGVFPESAVRLRATGFILDDDGDTSDDDSRALLVSDLQVVEGDGGERTAVFELLLSRSSATSITVPYSTVDGSAVAGEDYVAAAGSVVFAPGETRQVVEVDLLGDETVEATEFFSLVTTPPAAVGSGSAGAVGTAEILDDDTSPGLPEISITGARVVESSESFPQLVYTVTLSEPAGGPLSVSYRTVQGSGTALDYGVDYFEESGTVSFATGETSKTITISAEGREGFDETDEGVVVELVNPFNGVFPESAVRLRATGFILDDDGDISDDGSRALLVSDLQVVEGDGGERTAVFELQLSRSSAASITVPYSTVDGSAVAGEDYVAAAGSVVFAPGETRQVVEVDLLGDETVEATEFFSLVTTPPASVGSGSAGAVGTAEILDDDTSPGRPEISISGGRVVESAGSFPQLVYTVTLSEPAGTPVSVDYRTVQGSGTALDHRVDYFEESGTVSFATGETSKTITISAVGSDSFDETDEGVVVELVNPFNGIFPESAVRLRATGFILDDDGDISDDGSRALLVSDLQVVEGDGGERTAVFELLLSRSSAASITVPYSTVDGSAVAGEDYVAAAGSVVFAPGETRQVVEVDLLGDEAVEATEFFSLVTTPPAAVGSGSAGAVGTAEILDDDTSPGRPEISISGGRVVESAGSPRQLVYTVTLSEPAGTPVSVDYRTVQGSGTALDHRVDYFEESGTVSFATGETSKTITISAVGSDSFDETDEGVVVELVNPFNGIFPESAVRLRATGFILDDDGDISDDGSRALLVSDLQIVEGDGGERTAVFELLLSRSSAASITVPYSTVDGSAVAGEDYVAAAGSVVFAPGETRQVVEVDLLGDEAVEATEFFSLVTTPPASVGSGSAGAVGTAEILDDDTSPGRPEISISGGRVVESAGSPRQLVYTVTLSEPAGGPVSVGYRTVAGSGTAEGGRVDYFDESGTVSFGTGDTTKTITISVQGSDSFDETDESVVVELIDPVQATFPDNAPSISAVGYILDDDGDISDAGSIALRLEDAAPIREGDSGQRQATFNVSLSRPALETIVIDYATTGNSAVSGVDFVGTSGQLTFAPGQRKAAITVPILGDGSVEGDETFFLSLVENDEVAVFENTTAVGTILNDDIPNSPPTGGVTIAGDPFLDQPLLADVSALSDADGLGPLTYTWLRDGNPVAGANTAAYALTQQDLGAQISVTVAYTDGLGNAESVPADPVGAIGVRLTDGSGSNELSGSVGDDELFAGGGDDVLIGGPGDDLVNGGAGFDVLRVPHFASQYTWANGRLSGPEGTDTLVSIETVEFGAALGDRLSVLVDLDDLVDPDGAGPLVSEAENLLNRISDLYIAYFDRAPDVPGLAFWFKAIYEGVFGLDYIARQFTLSPEYAATYPPGLSNREFVETIYDNLFDRAPDPDGGDYWTDLLDRGLLPRDTFILSVIDGAYAPTGGPVDRALLNNKHDVSMYYAERVSLSPGEESNNAIGAVLNRVGADSADVDAAIALIDFAVDNPITITGIVADPGLFDSFFS